MSRIRVEELSSRYREACNFTQAIDEPKIKDALQRWIIACGGPSVEVKIAHNWGDAARAAGAAGAAGAAWDAGAARAARAAWDAWAAWDASWIACLSIGGAELGSLEEQKWLPVLESLEAGAWLYWVCNDLVTVVCLPEIYTDSTNRPHKKDGPAFVSLDLKYWFWKGVLVDQWIIEEPEKISVVKIDAEINSEVRRVLIERYGEDRYIIDSGLSPIAKDSFGELFRKDFSEDEPLVYIKLRNSTVEPDGTYRDYFLSVNPTHYNGDAGKIPQAAVASTWRTKPEGTELFFKDWHDYQPAIET